MRKTLLLICCALSSTWLAAQYQPMYPMEIGVQVGTTSFLGDLGGQSGIGRPFLRDTDFKSIRTTIGLFTRYNLSGNFALRAELNFLRIYGDDALAGKDFSSESQNGDDAWFRYYRNLSFRSNIWEFAIAGEIVPYNFEIDNGYNGYNVIAPYGTIGIGLFHFKSKAQYNGRWIDLKPLSTEGQGLIAGRPTYKSLEIAIPLGLGVKWIYNDKITLGLEVNHRLTFTDYIDDVSTNYIDPSVFYQNFTPEKADLAAALARRSVEKDPGQIYGYVSAPGEQRGDPKDNDSYYTITIRFSYLFDPRESGGSKRYGCPVW